MKIRIGSSLRPLAGAIALCCLLAKAEALPAAVGPFTWVGGAAANPADWNTAANWSPVGPPNSQTDVANFLPGAVNFTPTISGTAISVATTVFGAGGQAYTITVTDTAAAAGSLDFYGAGVTNNSSATQTFVVQSPNDMSSTITFHNSATAGNAVFQVINSFLLFEDTSTAGSAFITNSTSSASTSEKATEFFDSSTAGSATILNTGPSSTVATGLNKDGSVIDLKTGQVVLAGFTGFANTSSAGNANITNRNGGITVFSDNSSAGAAQITNSAGGLTAFQLSATAAGASITNNAGGWTVFFESATATNATTITNNPGGYLDISGLLNGGITIGQVTGAGNIYLGGNNLTVGGQNADATIGGVISDGNAPGDNPTSGVTNFTGGSLTKVGSGALTLTNANTYTGNTIVNQGALYVDGAIASPMTTVSPGALLGGIGIIGGSVFNGGTVSPGDGPGTLTIKGNYTQTSGGTLSIRMGGGLPAQYDLLAVGGAAFPAGTLQLVRINNFEFDPGQKITFLTAAGGVSGTFANVTNFTTGTLVNGQVVYGPNSVSVVGVQAPISTVAVSRNEKAVAHVLDSSINNPRLANLITYLDHDSLARAQRDLDKIGPATLTSLYQLAFADATQQGFTLERRLSDARAGSSGFSADGFATHGAPPAQSGGYEARGPAGVEGKEGKSIFSPAPDNRWGVFVTGVGEFASLGDSGNTRGYDLTSAGFTLGVDYKVTPNFIIGVAAGYEYGSADLAQGGRLISDGAKLDLYSSYFTGKGFYVDAAVQGGYNSYATDRTGIVGTARGETDGGEFTAILGTGYDFKAGSLTFGPTANFGYTYLGLGNFTERGSLAPLSFPDQHQESITTTLGAKASLDWKLGRVTVRPELRLGWQHEYSDATPGLSSRFANGAGSTFLVHGPDAGRDSLLVGAGFAILWSERFSTYVYYDGQLARTNYEANNVSSGFRFEF